MPFYNRKTPRAQRYDYSSEGMYFVTICTKNRIHYFGTIIDKKIILNETGKICDDELKIMLTKRPSVDLHEYVIMPNHIHLLLFISEWRDMGLPCPKNNTQSIIVNQILYSAKSAKMGRR